MSTSFQVGWIQKCPFLQYQFYPSWFKSSAGQVVCFFRLPAGVASLPSKGGVGWLVVYVNQRNSHLVPVSTKGIIDNKQCSYLIQRFYSQLLRYNLPANGEEGKENAVFVGKNTMKQ